MTWLEQAACAGQDPEMFFPVSRGRTGNDPHEARVARDLCRGCPVSAACLEDALTWESRHTQSYGVVGGMTSNQRRAIINKRKANT